MADHQDARNERDLDVLEELGYEPTDEAATSKIGVFGMFFFAFLMILLAGAYLSLTVADRVQGYQFRGNNTKRIAQPAEGVPLLQTNITATTDMHALREEEREKLEGYGQNEDGTYKIPIDKAMEQIAKRGLPTRSNAPAPEDL